MRNILFVFLTLLTINIYSQQMVASGVYKFSESDDDYTLIEGEITHFSDMKLKVVKLKSSGDEVLMSNEVDEQIIIIKEGEVMVKLDGETKVIGPNSVVFIHPDDNCLLKSESPEVVYYTMIYKSKKPVNLERGMEAGGSFIIDFDTLEFKAHDKGGLRNYFHTKTAMCPYYEMHVTNLNAGIKSHDPHTHHAAEIILMIDGNTEMEIGDSIYKANKGDVYFVASDVPHAIKNIGDKQCMYFAYQWE